MRCGSRLAGAYYFLDVAAPKIHGSSGWNTMQLVGNFQKVPPAWSLRGGHSALECVALAAVQYKHHMERTCLPFSIEAHG